METAKAVVEVPSPFTGRVGKLFGQPGNVIETGKPLAGFEVEGQLENDTPDEEDMGTVVGRVESSKTVVTDRLTNIGGMKISPAVRALARKLKVNIESIVATGKDGVITRTDVENAARNSTGGIHSAPAYSNKAETSHTTAIPKAIPRAIPQATPGAEWQPLRGTRRSMARVMADSHARVVPTSIMDDADVQQWAPGQDKTLRLLRSIRAGVRAEPGLNAWYDADQDMRLVHKVIDVGMAVDTPEGLFAAALRNVQDRSDEDIRAALDDLKHKVEKRSVPPADLRDYTIMLSNFGMIAGRYATPVITPPCVCIIAAGKARQEVRPLGGGFEAHRVIPLSLTFDHRVCTGGEAARFLRAMIENLALSE
jgi:pyruvate dehydrogenase E2 component (dihydrolipoamide acetyltransferase)